MKDYILLIGNGNGAASRGFDGDTFYTFRTKAENVDEAINNCQDEIRAIDSFDGYDNYLEDEPNLTYAEYFNDLDPSGGDIWMPAYIENGKVMWLVDKEDFLLGNDQFDNEEDAELFGLDLSNRDDEEYYDYDEAVEYLEDNGVSCDPGNSVGEYVCDLLDDLYEENDGCYTPEDLNNIINKAKKYRRGRR